MNILYIQIGKIKLIWLDEYTDESTGITYSQGYYSFPETNTIVLNTVPIETEEV